MRTPSFVASVAVALVAAGALAACSSGPASANNGDTCGTTTTFPTSALSTVTTDSGNLRVAIYSAPEQPLVAGLECLQLVVSDAATGSSVDGLSITMTPWMPAMGHGASVTPLLTPLGAGKYVFTNVSLFMPGEWQLRTKLTGATTGAAGDSVEPTFNVD